MIPEIKLDRERKARLGFDEAIFCYNKTAGQISAILADSAPSTLLLTRLRQATFDALPDGDRQRLDYDPRSETAFFGKMSTPTIRDTARVAIVTAGTSDAPAALEAARTLDYYGINSEMIFDVGVAGLWRLLERADELREFPVVIAVAGMDAALPSVLGGLLPGSIIAVPTSTGYGVAEGGRTALNAVLASCAPGVVVVNIDNGYGAACAALRMINQPALLTMTTTETRNAASD